jgi:hypothetical protein
MARGDKREVVVAVPEELVKLSRQEATSLKRIFQSSLANVVSTRATGDDDEMIIVINNNRDVEALRAEAATPRTARKSSKKGAAKKGATKKGAAKGRRR